MINNLKRKLMNDEACIGMFLTINSTEIVEILGIAGYDFVVVDMEHGPTCVQNVLPLLIAAERRGIATAVRIPEICPSTIVRILDLGAGGVQAPQVSNQKEAEKLIESSRYYPYGLRGMGSPRAGDYGKIELKEYIHEANENTITIAQCESWEGYNSLEEIAKLDGLDVIFLGPYDMSQSLGVPGEVKSEQMDCMREKILQICAKYNKIPGTFAENGAEAARLKDKGFKYIIMGMDVDHVLDKLRGELRVFNGDRS